MYLVGRRIGQLRFVDYDFGPRWGWTHGPTWRRVDFGVVVYRLYIGYGIVGVVYIALVGKGVVVGVYFSYGRRIEGGTNYESGKYNKDLA